MPSAPARTSAVAKPPRLVPRDAATLVLVDHAGPAPRILMGRRRADLVFLAGKYVFPGGRVDAADKTALTADDLSAADVALLLAGMRGRPSIARARALAIAAIRELREEAGLGFTAGPPPLSTLRFFARAITPPGRPRRYDTRFFLADAAALEDRELGGDGELTDLGWFTLDEMRALELPGITRLIVEDIAERLAAGQNTPAAIPFYSHRNGVFRRDRLILAGDSPTS